MRDRRITIDLKPDSAPCMLQFLRFFIPHLGTIHERGHRRVIKGFSPLRFAGDHPDHFAAIAEGNPYEVGSAPSVDLADPPGIEFKCQEKFLYVIMLTEEEDRDAPRMAAYIVFLIGFGHETGQNFAEQSALCFFGRLAG